MPYRRVPLVKNHFYHVYNRGLNRQLTFKNNREYARANVSLWYYRFQNTSRSLNSYLKLPEDVRNSITQNLEKEDLKHVDIITYCLMPNHFHLLLKQLSDGGISKFVGNFQNSYTRYYNLRHKLQGPLFIPRFKAVLVETEEQLAHVSRYIHLNPYTSAVVSSPEDTIGYQYSSFKEFLEIKIDGLISGQKIILDYIGGENKYKKFVLNHADYQKNIHKIRHLLLDK